MTAFPQLSSGAMAQFPVERETRFRVRRNETRGGATVELGDPDFEERRWDLSFRELSDAEWAALEQLFSASKGRLGVFTLLDPGINLLSWSEDLSQSPWQAAGGVTANRPDPFGGTGAALLSSGASVSQAIAAPSDYRYAASAWLKSAGAGAAIRLGDGGANVFERSVPPTNEWTRLSVRYEASSSTDTIRISLLAGGGAPLEVFGPQLEPQASASAYKRSSALGGVFSNTRFDQDVLVDEATGPGRHSTRVRLIWTPSQS